jgi:hypothetical protein
LDSNQRRQKPAGLQPAPIGHSGNPPEDCLRHPAVVAAEPFVSVIRSIRAGEGTRTPNRLFTKQVLYLLSYTSKSRRPPSAGPVAGRYCCRTISPDDVSAIGSRQRPANMVSRVEYAPVICSSFEGTGPNDRGARTGWGARTTEVRSTASDNCALRSAFALPAGKNHARREIVRREAIDASRPANPNRTQLRADSLTPPWGNTNAQVPRDGHW